MGSISSTQSTESKVELEFLDGGMIFELNKKYSDRGEQAVTEDIEFVKQIHQGYIDIGCNYITSANYGFKERCQKEGEWQELTLKSVKALHSLKKEGDKFTILGCLPPYHESYHDGPVDEIFINYFEKVIPLMEPYVDMFAIETQMSHKHILKILEILEKLTDKKTFLSIYPLAGHTHDQKGKTEPITHDQVKEILDRNFKNLTGLFVNCCELEDMKKFFAECYYKQDLSKMTHLGFYCNKIDAKKYAALHGDAVERLGECLKENIIEEKDLREFLDDFKKRNLTQKIVIGGCCGYGITEMKELLKVLTNIKKDL